MFLPRLDFFIRLVILHWRLAPEAGCLARLERFGNGRSRAVHPKSGQAQCGEEQNEIGPFKEGVLQALHRKTAEAGTSV